MLSLDETKTLRRIITKYQEPPGNEIASILMVGTWRIIDDKLNTPTLTSTMQKQPALSYNVRTCSSKTIIQWVPHSLAKLDHLLLCPSLLATTYHCM